MDGLGVLKGLWVTARHFFGTFLDDIIWFGRRYFKTEGIDYRMSSKVQGIFTVQYPEEKLPVPEEFRYIPFLVYENQADGGILQRCTSCGICAKVCPPQCIWIVRTTDPKTGRPVPEPAEFYIDIDICMNCGFCAEYCPFDAIKMDHDYEIAVYDRLSRNVYNKQKLSKPLDYYATIRPANFSREENLRAQAESAKAARKAAAELNVGN